MIDRSHARLGWLAMAAALCAGSPGRLVAQSLDTSQPTGLLFTSFRGNGEDGLHLATSVDGYTWRALGQDRSYLRPEVGGRLMRDPHLIQGPDGLFHLIWTTSWNLHGAGYARSTDLIHWSDQRHLDVMRDVPGTRNVWAPEMIWDPARKRYLIIWSSTVEGRFPEADDGSEKGYNHRIYATTTADFVELEPARLCFDPGFNVIDATITPAPDGYLMFFKDERLHPPAKRLHWAASPNIDGPYGPISPPITGPEWGEGPTAISIDGVWHVYYDRYQEHRYGLVTSRDLTRWRDETDRVHFPEGHRHGSVLRVPRAILQALEDDASQPQAQP